MTDVEVDLDQYSLMQLQHRICEKLDGMEKQDLKKQPAEPMHFKINYHGVSPVKEREELLESEFKEYCAYWTHELKDESKSHRNTALKAYAIAGIAFPLCLLSNAAGLHGADTAAEVVGCCGFCYGTENLIEWKKCKKEAKLYGWLAESKFEWNYA